MAEPEPEPGDQCSSLLPLESLALIYPFCCSETTNLKHKEPAHSDSINDQDVRAPSARVHTSGQLGWGQVTQGKESSRATGSGQGTAREMASVTFRVCRLLEAQTDIGQAMVPVSLARSHWSTCRHTQSLLNLGTYPSFYILHSSHLWAFGHQSSFHRIYGKTPYSLKPTTNATYNHLAPPTLTMSSILGFGDRPSASLSSAV